MTLHRIDLEQEALADFSLLMSEAAIVLHALATATTAAEREDELADLRAIHAEGADFRPGTPTARDLHRMFDGMAHLGERLAGQPVVSAATQARIQQIHRLAQALAAAFEEPSANGALRQANREIAALDPHFAGALDLPAAAAAGAALVEDTTV